MADVLPTWVATHVGHVRARNEDRCRTSVSRVPEDGAWRGEMPREGGWVVVADGMGGHGAGEVASETAVGILAKLLPTVRDEEALWTAIHMANERVHDAMSDPGGRPGMGTTIVGALFRGDSCTVFNVGDSRAYLVRAGRLRLLTVDDVPTLVGSSGRRSHALTQSLGGTLSRRPLRPHVTTIAMQRHDRMLLCTDGLSDLVDNNVIVTTMERAASHPADALVQAALDAGGYDNVTAVVVDA